MVGNGYLVVKYVHLELDRLLGAQGLDLLLGRRRLLRAGLHDGLELAQRDLRELDDGVLLLAAAGRACAARAGVRKRNPTTYLLLQILLP